MVKSQKIYFLGVEGCWDVGGQKGWDKGLGAGRLGTVGYGVGWG